MVSSSSSSSISSSSSTPSEYSDDPHVRSATDIRINEQIFESVERSMCRLHFGDFVQFHEGLDEMAWQVAFAGRTVKNRINSFFPPPPLKIGSQEWNKFWRWLGTELGEPIRDLCRIWCVYAGFALSNCAVCHMASTDPYYFDIGSDDEVEEVEGIGDENQEMEGAIEVNPEIEGADFQHEINPQEPAAVVPPAAQYDPEDQNEEEIEAPAEEMDDPGPHEDD